MVDATDRGDVALLERTAEGLELHRPDGEGERFRRRCRMPQEGLLLEQSHERAGWDHSESAVLA